MTTATAARGAKFQALSPLSVPRGPEDTTHQNDLVNTGETVTLAPEVAAHFLGECGCATHRIRRTRPVIRKIAEAKEPLVPLTARDMSGPLRSAPVGARPDPAGSSRVIVREEVPEARSPATDNDASLDQDAVDLPPGTRISAG